MTDKLKEFEPREKLKSYINSFWFSCNNTGKEIKWPVVPDGCSDIIFYLPNSKKLDGVNDTFVTGIMEQAQLIPIPQGVNLFGIRFNPGRLGILLEVDMSKISDDMLMLSELNLDIFQRLNLDFSTSDYKDIIQKEVEEKIFGVISKTNESNLILDIIDDLISFPNSTIEEVTKKYKLSTKSLERNFLKIVGITPKKFARIMRFQKAHKKISKEGLENLISVALSAGYFDQAHFNREYRKLTGHSPSSEAMSILYNQ